jgi:transcriptional regulator with XRE-family HTH domain
LQKRGLSERELSKRLGVEPRRIAKWRQGKSLPDLYETVALAKELEVTEELFRNPPVIPPQPAYPIDQYLLENVRGKDLEQASG